jgi:hypothetical protein
MAPLKDQQVNAVQDKIAVYSENHTNNTNTLCEQAECIVSIR